MAVSIYRGFPTRMVYLYYISCLRYTFWSGTLDMYLKVFCLHYGSIHIKLEGFRLEWYISTTYHCRDMPFWSETLALRT